MHSPGISSAGTSAIPSIEITSRPSNRYENIDALRAIAALSVVIQHFFGDIIHEATNTEGIAYSVASSSVSYFDAGRFGVVLFFLISGFVVPFSIRGTFPVRRFAISRFFRLYPAMWLALFCLAIASTINGQPPTISLLLSNMSMLPTLFHQPWMSGAYWTLTIEIIFYAFSAGLFLAGVLYRPAIIAVCAIVLALATAIPIVLRSAGISLPVQYISLHVSFLYLGLLLRMALVDRLSGAYLGSAIVLITQAIILLTIGEFSLSRNDGFFLVGTLPILTSYIAALGLFVFSVKTDRPNMPVLSWLGELSYSIYLFHGIAALMVFTIFPLTGEWSDFLIGLLSLVLTLAISLAVYERLEKPMISIGRKFIKAENIKGSKMTI